MIAPEIRAIMKIPSYGEFLEEVKGEVLRLVGEEAIDFQEEQLSISLGIT